MLDRREAPAKPLKVRIMGWWSDWKSLSLCFVPLGSCSLKSGACLPILDIFYLYYIITILLLILCFPVDLQLLQIVSCAV